MTSDSSPRDEKGRIKLLSDALVDQIAAGEVVERPASVVKELVENSLDAEATRIRVEVRDGGAALIAITDDGFGLTPAELPLALQRHATSKLRSAADLMRIQSFGFRGEALPAIASVSRFRIRSRARGHAEGYEIECEGGRVVREAAAGGPEGTRIEVADLFASVPARRKFLKRPGTEWGHIADWLARLALIRPDVHLEFQRDDRAATIWPACDDLRDRVAMVMSEDDAAALIEVDHATPEARVHAFVSTPERTRRNAKSLYLFVNGRPVRDPLLRHALIEAYRDLLPRGRFPLGVLRLEVPAESVDVNVHPAKWEVRFSDPQSIHRAIRHAVRDAMASRSWLGGGALADRPAGSAPGEGPARARVAATDSRIRATGRPQPETSDWIFASREPHSDANASGSWVREGSASPPVAASEAPVASFGSLKRLGQLSASYLLAEGAEGLIVVDQHAAHERVLYERLRASWLDAGVARQGLLQPLTIEIPASAVAAVAEAGELIERLGFEIEPFGDDAVLVRAIPAEVAGQDVGELVTELATAIEENDARGQAQVDAIRWLPTLDRLFATMACHSARRFGDHLGPEEQRAILEGLDSIPWAPTCPHGRPVAISLSLEDLEARFRRR